MAKKNQEETTARRVIIAVQPKGSAGKTTWGAAFIAWVVQTQPGVRLVAYDPDTTHRTLTKIFGPEGTTPLKAPHALRPLDWRGDDGNVVLDSVMRALSGDFTLAFVDGVANQAVDVFTWAEDVKLFREADAAGIGLTFVIPVDETAETAKCAIDALKEIGGRATVLIVRNEKKRRQLPFDLAWQEAGASVPRCQQMTLRGWSPDVTAFLQGTGTGRPNSLWQATQQRIDSFTRNRAETYWENFLAEIGNVSAVLLP
jgi:hypothetical protein